MKIAVFHSLPSGGAKRSLFEMVKRLTERHTIDVYTVSTANEEFCDLRPLSTKYHVFPMPWPSLLESPFGRINQFNRWRHLQQIELVHRQIAGEIDDENYDVVFAQPSQWTQAPLLLKYLLTPTVYYLHEPPRHLYESIKLGTRDGRWSAFLDRLDPLIKLYRSTAKRLDWEATRSASLVVVNSNFTQQVVQRIYGVSSEVCYNAVDIDIFCPLEHAVKHGFVLSVGAVQPLKGFDFLIESLAHIPETQRPLLHLVGNAESRNYGSVLKQLAQKHQVELTIEIGVPLETLVSRYNEAALFAYAPYNEPFGLTPLEAMACGTPVIGVAEGGVQESIEDGVNGRLVPRDPIQFARVIQEWLQDAALRQKFGEQGRRYVLSRWTWETAASQLETYMQKIISGSH